MKFLMVRLCKINLNCIIPVKYTMPRFPTGFVFLFIFLYLSSSGQGIVEPAEWKKIDSAIRSKRNIGDIENRVLSIKTKAIAEHNDAALAKCFVDLMMIKDRKTEDTLFFRNAAFMDSILNSPYSSALLKSIMHLLLARRIDEFRVRFYYQKNITLIRTGNPAKEYALMDRKVLDSLASDHLDTSISISKQLRQTSVDGLLWLSSDPLLFLFRPDYIDLLYGEKIFMRRGFGNRSQENACEWLSESQDAFIQHGDQIKTFNQNDLILFRIYHEWILYNFRRNPEAAYFIETLARKAFYHNLMEDSACKAAYENYLGNMLLSPYPSVTIHAVYQLCKIWYADAGFYNTTLTTHIIKYGHSLKTYDSSYRLYYNKTIQLLNRFDKSLDSFPYLKADLLNLKADILSRGLNIILQDIQLPDVAIPVLLQYRNISHLYTRTIRINPFEVLTPGKSGNISRFMKMSDFSAKDRSLILTDDHQWHNAFLTWEPLAAGRYIILYSDTVFSGNIERINYIDLSVTNIAVINNDHRIFVLNRKTGLPINGATVLATVEEENKNNHNDVHLHKILPPKTVNEQGYVVIHEKKVDRVEVYTGNDSLRELLNETDQDIPNELYSKDEYDDLSDYYEENIHLNIFTDRAIYRPGQTVFYKGIFTVPDPKTGELRVLDFQKIRFPFFENMVYKTVLLFKKLKSSVTISDPFNRTVDSFSVTPNKFGSFSGSFIIPKDAATGEWDFESEDYDMENRNSGKFQVEEYKRPGFKLTLTKPAAELQMGDDFNVLIKARSFAGAALDHVRLRYHVYRRSFGEMDNELILDGELYSNEMGESTLFIHDSTLKSSKIPGDTKVSVEYVIHIEALDDTGESHEQDLTVNLSNRPVNITISIPENMDRNKMLPVNISMKNIFSGPVKKPVDIYIYRKSGERESENDFDFPPPDVWIENKDEWQKKFLDIKFNGSSESKPEKYLVYKTSLSADTDKKITLPTELLVAGSYRMEAVCSIDGKVTGETVKDFSVYDTKENSFPGKEFEWLPAKDAFSGDTLKLISGNANNSYFSIYHMSYLAKSKNGAAARYDYNIRLDKKGLNEMAFKIPYNIIGSLTLTHLYILQNRIYRREHRIRIAQVKSTDPDIIIEKYRTQISPGEKETFMVSIKTKNLRDVAELMTTMYDASLDELEPHNWAIPGIQNYYSPDNRWNRSITYLQTNKLYETESLKFHYQKKGNPLWWISSPDILPAYFSDQFNQSGNQDFETSGMLQSQVSGLYIENYSLNDVVVIGYGISSKALTSTVTTVGTLGFKSLSRYAQPLIILDGIVFTGDINNISPASIFQGIILKGADAVTLYGERAANGVLILSTHGPVILPKAPETPPPPLVIRKNFSETAFFYPMIYAGGDGMYSISFTLPESVTEWKWKLFAHTRNAEFAYVEKSLFSQLPLMVQPSMPRFLYQGDKLVLKTRITNLDSADLTGLLKCTIEDYVTGENISSLILKDSAQALSIKHQSNTAGSFMLSIPADFLHPLRVRISAATNKFSDGEEHIIPVLSKKFLLTQTKKVKSEPGHAQTLSAPAFPQDAEPYGLSLYINPKPQATLMDGLSYLAFDPFGCSEQTLNKMLAFSMAVHIARLDSFLRQGISKIPGAEKAGNKEKDEPEPDEQTMPWLHLSHAASIQQQKIKQLFDTAKSKQSFEKELTELMAMQNADGGLSWFKGGRTDYFISCYVLAGLGKMYQDKLLEPDFVKLENRYPEFISRLITYVDQTLISSIGEINPIELLYARSYWMNDHPVSASVRSVADSVLQKHLEKISSYSMYEQATVITIGLRFAVDPGSLREQSLKHLESIRQLAISDSVSGVRWKAFSNSDDLNQQEEETMARIAEAFQTAGSSGNIIPGIIHWLLKTRSEHAWTTTKSTGAIIGLLQTSDLPGETHRLMAKTGDSVLSVNDDLFSGKTADFVDLTGKKFPYQISVSSGSPAPVSGSIKYYYFSSIPSNDSLNTAVNIHKSLYRYNALPGTWEPINEKTALQVSDKIKTVLTINTAKQLNYVFINERRAAAMEPREIESGYKYEDGLDYYQSVKDAGYLIFVDKIPSGIHNLSYETVISASGNFTNGPASLQCMYQPSINAYSNADNIIVNP